MAQDSKIPRHLNRTPVERPPKEPPPLPPPPGTLHRYLRPEDTRSLRDLEFRPRRMTHGLFTGRHASPQRGQSSEFNDYREYTPGDEVRHLDWKVLGRSDRLYIKTFEHQAQMNVHLIVDASASMVYGRPPAKPRIPRTPGIRHSAHPPPDGGKYDHACRLAAAVGYLVIRQQDRVSASFAHPKAPQPLPARGTIAHLFAIVRAMEALIPAGKADLPLALSSLLLGLKRRSVILLFSDLMESDPSALMKVMRMARHRGHDLSVFHVLHDHELNLPAMGETLLTDSESPDQKMRVNTEEIREHYQERLAEFLRRWHDGFMSMGVDHHIAPVSRTPPDILRDYLIGRSALR